MTRVFGIVKGIFPYPATAFCRSVFHFAKNDRMLVPEPIKLCLPITESFAFSISPIPVIEFKSSFEYQF
jgi:hypothetical protein